jgi:hypothetical protein
MSQPDHVAGQLRQSASPLLEALRIQLANLRDYVSDDIQKLVSECEEVVLEIDRDLDSIVTISEKHGV